MGRQAGQIAPEGPRRALDEEARQEFFRVQKPREWDAKHKLIRRYEVTDAAVHDSQKLDRLLTKGNTSAEVFADSAYCSTEASGDGATLIRPEPPLAAHSKIAIDQRW